jgi:hypothetical protein
MESAAMKVTPLFAGTMTLSLGLREYYVGMFGVAHEKKVNIGFPQSNRLNYV